MIRHKEALRNILIIVVLFFLFLNRTGLYLTPISAHESSEKSAHYGPSKVVYIEDFEKGKHILGKFDRWVSCNTVNKQLLFFWAFGNQVHGFENDITRGIDFSYGASHEYYKFYGIRNNVNISKVEIALYNGKVYETTEFYENLFLITWVASDGDDESIYIKNIKGYDLNNKLVFEEEH